MTFVGIFVDGVGRQQRRLMPSLSFEYRFPRREKFSVALNAPPPLMMLEDHRFRLAWSRGRVGVYGFVFASGGQFEVWAMDASWTHALDRDGLVQVLQQQDSAVERFLSRSGALGPVITLLEFIWADPLTLITTRQIIGIARRPS